MCFIKTSALVAARKRMCDWRLTFVSGRRWEQRAHCVGRPYRRPSPRPRKHHPLLCRTQITLVLHPNLNNRPLRLSVTIEHYSITQMISRAPDSKCLHWQWLHRGNSSPCDYRFHGWSKILGDTDLKMMWRLIQLRELIRQGQRGLLWAGNRKAREAETMPKCCVIAVQFSLNFSY